MMRAGGATRPAGGAAAAAATGDSPPGPPGLVLGLSLLAAAMCVPRPWRQPDATHGHGGCLV